MASKPVFEARLGLIKVRVWRKRTKKQICHSVTVIRIFRNGEVWKESSRYGPDDIPLVRLLLDDAHTWIYQQSSKDT